jgi:hypothetical protein
MNKGTTVFLFVWLINSLTLMLAGKKGDANSLGKRKLTYDEEEDLETTRKEKAAKHRKILSTESDDNYNTSSENGGNADDEMDEESEQVEDKDDDNIDLVSIDEPVIKKKPNDFSTQKSNSSASQSERSSVPLIWLPKQIKA